MLVSNEKLGRNFSMLEVINVGKRASLSNNTLDDVLVLNTGNISILIPVWISGGM